jgi:hypothetical protein
MLSSLSKRKRLLPPLKWLGRFICLFHKLTHYLIRYLTAEGQIAFEISLMCHD